MTPVSNFVIKTCAKTEISGEMIGYGFVCYVVNFPPGEYLLYSKVSGGKVYYIVNIPRGNVCYAEGLLYNTGIIFEHNNFQNTLKSNKTIIMYNTR
jgi:hypothetical protein